MPFHAHMTDERRTQVLELWKKGLVECIVATIAFGMVGTFLFTERVAECQGVDQAHVRYVIHYDMPKSFEGTLVFARIVQYTHYRLLPRDWSSWS